MGEAAYVTVSALTKYIKRKFDVDPHLENIWIKGELSNVKIHTRAYLFHFKRRKRKNAVGDVRETKRASAF